ncbi:MAG TPA: amino acid adenylation domain-containing protein, partial [Planctomycetota bacterium]|nr:amino acid adenylation domain-containing protein [Planctomycetota bacterium]
LPPPYAECELWLPAPDDERLRSFAHRSGLTLNTLVQAAWALLLSRWSGRDDVLFGITVAGRPAELAGVERRIGLFINTLPLRLHIDGDRPTGDLLRAVQSEIAAMLAWQHTPLPVSQAQCDAPRDPVESLVVFENYPLDEALRDLPDGLRLESTRAFERTSYPLTLVAMPGERLCLRLLHDSDRWSPQLAEQLLASLATVLAQFAHERARTAREIDWLPPAVRKRAARLAAGPAAPEPELVLPALLARARACGTATAIEHAGRTTSYAELIAMAARAAQRLLRVRTPGDDPLVAVCCERSAEAIAALLGIWWCGGAYLPLDPDWPAARRRDVLASARPLATIVDAGADASWAAGHASIDLGTLCGAPGAGGDTHQAPPLPAHALAYAIATSGTTGAPKIVLVEHGSLANYVAAAAAQFSLRPDDRVLQFASLAFDTAAEEIWPALCAGATLVLRTAEQATSSARFLAAAHAQRTTVWDLPTAFFHQLVHALADRVPASLRLCIVGGQAVHADAVAAFLRAAPAVRLCNTYGPSEATIVATWCDLRPEPGDRPPPIGRPVPGTSAWVLDDTLQPLPIGVPGELCLAGRCLARGYLDAGSEAGRFVTRAGAANTPERLFRTGDLARHREDGQLEFLGRRDRQVKIAGQRVELEAVERVLSSHAAVTEAVAATRGGEPDELVAWVEAPAPGIDAQQLRTFVRERLPAACVPAHIHVLEAMPRLVSGKVDHERLPALQPLPAPPDVGAASAHEAAVREVFVELFPGRPVSLDDDFFALGGSSLLAVRLLDALQARFAREVSIQALFDDPTPRGIAALLGGAAGDRSHVQPEQLRRDADPGDTLPQHTAIAWRPPSAVLLTGATGFFGSWILRELLRAPTTAVFCLVRAGDARAARDRLATALANTDASTDTLADARLHVVCGDVSQPDFGLDPAAAQTLGTRVTTVVHAAAAVDFLRPYAQLHRANVAGTREVLRFCAAHGLVLHHVSSVGVFTDPRAARLAQIDEAIDLDRFDRPRGGYAQSKWVAERLVAAAVARGLPASVHRPGRLVADGRIGRGNPADFASALLRLCRDLGQAVVMPGSFDLTPVDWAAAALVHILQRPDAIGRTFHLVHARPTPARELLSLWRAAGVPLVETSWPEFRAAAVALLQRSPDHPARALLPFLLAAEAAPGLGEPHFTSHHTAAAVQAGGPRCPAIDAALVRLWAAQFGR